MADLARPTLDGRRQFFDAAPDSLPDRVAERYESSPPAVPIAGTYLAGWAALALLFTLTGWLLTGVVLHGRVGGWDETASRWLAERRTPWLNGVTGAATFIANTIPVIAIVALACLVLLLLRRWREAVFLAGALALEVTVFLTANSLADRSRPDVPRLDSTPSTGSFPSGHAAASLALWVGLAIILSTNVHRRVLNVLAWIVAVLFALMVAFARLYRGMHHVTDVIAGMSLGVAALGVSLVAVRVVSATVARHRAQDQLTTDPVADPTLDTPALGSSRPSPSPEVAR
jgi:undecaprenyl-diphosphatase